MIRSHQGPLDVVTRPEPDNSSAGHVSTVSLDTYKELVDRCARERLNFPIANGSPFHARILISKLFEVAQQDVTIVTGTLRDRTRKNIDIYGYADVITQARRFLTSPDTELCIIVQEGEVDRGNDNRLLAGIVNDENRNGTVSVSIPKRDSLEISIPHFMVADSYGYRLEPGEIAHNASDAESIVAIANFGDPETGRGLRGYFSDLVESLKSLNTLKSVHTFKPGEQLSIS